MQRAPPEAHMAPNQFTYNALISVLTFGGRLELATEKFREMKEVRQKEKRSTTRQDAVTICRSD